MATVAPLDKAADHAAWQGEMFDGLPLAAYIIGNAGQIWDVNAAAEALFNRSRGAMVGKNAGQWIDLGSAGSFDVWAADAAQPATAFSANIHVTDGRVVQADLTLGAAQQGWRLLLIHVTARGGRGPLRQPGAGARSATAAAAMLAHEVKNPLSGIRGAAQLLARDGDDTQRRALSNLIVGEVDRIAALIDSMQDFTRDAPVATSPVNIYPAIRQACEVARKGFAADVRLEEDFDPSLPQVHANHDALVQILLNLLKNGARAAGKGGSLRLHTAFRPGILRADDARALPIEIAVLDNGPGIDAALGDSIFDPFVSGNSDGQGLGLALVDKLVRDMGGIIEQDRHAGWTRFRLHLALAGTQV
ncbi:MAG: two-component sensor histidine kinase [Sphingomonadaceae bacterium]|nr:two-component sensor histidine kinase [Sphingomonadaceae bacterium]